jgi:formylglycine-generating enzyme required for sulfatase activity
VRLVPLNVEAYEAPLLWSSYQFISFRNTYKDGLQGLLSWLDPPKTSTPPQPPVPVQKSTTVEPGGATSAQPGRRISPDFLKIARAATNQLTVQTLLGILTIESPIHLELVRVPAGEFLMGSDPKVDKDAVADEQPQHRLYLPEFYIGKYPVTNEQYAAFVKTGRQGTPKHWEKGEIPVGKGDYPVVDVSWQDAVAFCWWLSRESGKTIRLPSEAEWEKAARGSYGRIYPWGSDPPTKELCNFGDYASGTTPVGRYPAGASLCGALDMAGTYTSGRAACRAMILANLNLAIHTM